MKTYRRTFKRDLTIIDKKSGQITLEYKKGDTVITSQTKNGICAVFDTYYFYCKSKYFTNVTQYTK